MAITASNEAALFALRGLQDATHLFTQATRRLSTGLRVIQPSDDPGAYHFGERMRAYQKSYDRLLIDNQANRSLVQTADGGIDTIIAHLQKIRTLAINSANSTLTSADRKANEAQLVSLRNEITSISNSTKFNTKVLLDGSFAVGRSTLAFQVGPDNGNVIRLNIRTLSATAIGIGGIAVSTQAAASAAISVIDSAISLVTREAANVGATDNRLEIGRNFIASQNDAYLQAISGALDADIASETVALAKASILRQTASSALAQANLYPQNVLAAILPGK